MILERSAYEFFVARLDDGTASWSRDINTAGTLWYTLDGSDPRPPYNRGNPRGQLGDKQVNISLETSTHVKARIFHEGEWSALYEGKFIPKIENTPDLQNIEIMYNPAEGDMYEFLENCECRARNGRSGRACFC